MQWWRHCATGDSALRMRRYIDLLTSAAFSLKFAFSFFKNLVIFYRRGQLQTVPNKHCLDCDVQTTFINGSVQLLFPCLIMVQSDSFLQTRQNDHNIAKKKKDVHVFCWIKWHLIGNWSGSTDVHMALHFPPYCRHLANILFIFSLFSLVFILSYCLFLLSGSG